MVRSIVIWRYTLESVSNKYNRDLMVFATVKKFWKFRIATRTFSLRKFISALKNHRWLCKDTCMTTIGALNHFQSSHLLTIKYCIRKNTDKNVEGNIARGICITSRFKTSLISDLENSLKFAILSWECWKF